MITKLGRINEKKFMEIFMKKLKSFLNKAPIKAGLLINEKIVCIENINDTGENFVYEIDYKLDKKNNSIDYIIKKNIKSIKDYLHKHYYPVFIIEQKEFLPLSPIEKSNLLEKGCKMDDVLLMKKEYKKSENYKIIKVVEEKIIDSNKNNKIYREELFIEKIQTGEVGRFLLKPPMRSSIFLKRVREEWDQKETGKEFLKRTSFLNRIYPNFSGEKTYKDMYNNILHGEI